jgi:hypothetical protein
MTDNDVLTQLDWTTITCQCEITHHCTHRNKPCPNPATRRIEFHAVDHCNTPELGEFGNYVFLNCEPCLNTLGLNVEAHIKRLNAFGRAICLTCGAPIAQIDHIIREIEAL